MSSTVPTATRAPIRSTLDEAAKTVVAAALQPQLVDLLDLTLTAKQLHWNVVGPQFKPVHEHLDELVDAYRTWSDEVAERMTAVGISPDGRLQRVAGDSPADPAPEDWVSVETAVDVVTGRIEAVARATRARLEGLGEADPGSEDLLIAILQGLEQQLWMFSAQQAP